MGFSERRRSVFAGIRVYDGEWRGVVTGLLGKAA